MEVSSKDVLSAFEKYKEYNTQLNFYDWYVQEYKSIDKNSVGYNDYRNDIKKAFISAGHARSKTEIEIY